MERSPHWSRSSGRTSDHMRDSGWSIPSVDYSPWEELMFKQFVKDHLPWVKPYAEAGEEHTEEEVAEI